MVRLILILVWLAQPAPAQDATPPARDEARLELILDDPETAPFQDQMVLATIRGLYRVRITLEDLKLRPMADFEWIRLGQDAWTEERIDGRAYRVLARRIALFPKRAGELTILPIAHQIQYLDPKGQRTDTVIRSEPVRISVRPPPDGADDDWLPVRALEISDSWNEETGRLEDGESASRRVVLRALGATPEMLPKQPPMREPWLITFTPPEQRTIELTPQGPVTTVVWTWTLRPVTGEPGVIPAVTIPYYDTMEGRAGIATIPAAPIGYESFADNSADAWRSGFGTSWISGLALATGMLVPLLLTARRRRMRRGIAGALLKRLQHEADMRALRRAARRSDPVAVRMHAIVLIERAAPSDRKKVGDILEPLDRHIFGGRKSPKPDLTQFARELRSLLRSASS